MAAVDWISLAEAAEILRAANIHFRRSATGPDPVGSRASSSVDAGSSGAAR
jgi:hypothetical protein